MSHSRRLDKLEAKTPVLPSELPTRIALVGICPETHEAVSATVIVIGGERESYEREAGETLADFETRFSWDVTASLPGNGR